MPIPCRNIGAASRAPSRRSARPALRAVLLAACSAVLVAGIAAADAPAEVPTQDLWTSAGTGALLTSAQDSSTEAPRLANGSDSRETLRPARPDHSGFTEILGSIVTADGFVRYDRLVSRHLEALEAYIRSLEAMDAERFSALSRNFRLAFWLNAYNAYTLQLMAQHPGADSIRNLRSGNPDWAFDEPVARLGHLAELGREVLSLNDIEHRIIRPEFRDARIHFVLVCAATSCPPLHREAFDGGDLDRTLDRLTRAFATDRRHVRLEGEEVHVSRLFEWFSEDFDAAHGSARAYLLHYLPAEHPVRAALEGGAPLRFLEYDWSINRPR